MRGAIGLCFLAWRCTSPARLNDLLHVTQTWRGGGGGALVMGAWEGGAEENVANEAAGLAMVEAISMGTSGSSAGSAGVMG